MIREHFFTTTDQDAWRKHLPERRSVFGSLGYARICQAFRGYSPRLYVVESGGTAICYPIFLRSLTDLAFTVETSGKWDSVTPDFTGPLMFDRQPGLATALPGLRNALFREEGIIAEFAHLHPWSPVLGENCVYNREIVWVDVTVGPEALWSYHLNRSCKRGIARAEQESVKVFAATSDDHIREFCRIYYATMNRNSALPGYYFPYEFFKAFREELPENSRFVMAEYRGQVIAGTLCLYDDDDVFEFLGGSDAAFQQVSPFHAVIWEAIRWAHEAGKKRLTLGGGYKPNDGIFQFKSGFSRLRQPFYIYKRIHLEQDYALLERRCREHYGIVDETLTYFPSYRQVAAPDRLYKPPIVAVGS